MVETVQKTVESPQLVLLLDKVVDVPLLATSWSSRGSAVAVHRLVTAHHGYDELMRRLYRAVYIGTRPGLTPAIRAGKGWRERRELPPRRSAIRISCIVIVHRQRFSMYTRSAPQQPQQPQPPQPPHKVQAHSFSRCAKVAPFCVGDFSLYLQVDDARASAQCCTCCGSRRRRERRLRQFLRHERLTVAMLLATYLHHAAPRGQSRARSGVWERGALLGQVPEHPTPQVAGMDVDEVPATGSRPDRLLGVRPQERVQHHPVDCAADGGTAGGRPPFLRYAVHVIDVPEISLEDINARRLCRVPQLVEQLVEVPTVVSYSSLLQRTVEQHVDNPASRGRGRLAGLQGSLPRTEYNSGCR